MTRTIKTTRTRWMLGLAVFTAIMLASGCAGNASRPVGKNTAAASKHGQVKAILDTSAPDPADQKRIEQAMQMLKSGDPAGAIQGPIARVLAHFPDDIEDGGTRYYSADTQMEMILYAGLDAGKHDQIDVKSGEWVTALFLEGFAYNSMQQFEAARRVLRKAAALAPFNAHIHNELGFTCEKLKDWPQAMDAFKNAETATEFLDGTNKIAEKTRAIRGQGFVLVELGKLDAAEAAYHRALKLDPDDTKSRGELKYIQRLRAKKAPTNKSAPSA